MLERSRQIYESYEVCAQDQDRIQDYPFLATPLKICAQKGGVLIDCGCGRGYWFDYYNSLGISQDNIIGVDFSRKAIESIRSRGFRGIVADLSQISDLSSESADLVLALGSIHHAQDMWSALNECLRLVKPGGELVVNVYNIWHPYFWFIHRLATPIRYISYLLGDKWTRLWSFPFLIFFQIQNWLRREQFLNKKDLWAVFYDQVMVPYAHLCRLKKMKRRIQSASFTILNAGYNLSGTMHWIHARKCVN